jgi:hypothetical protein
VLQTAFDIIECTAAFIAPGRWFYCDDAAGFLFIPPFAHTDVTTYGHTGDRYRVARSFVYSVYRGDVYLFIGDRFALKIDLDLRIRYESKHAQRHSKI